MTSAAAVLAAFLLSTASPTLLASAFRLVWLWPPLV